MICVLLLLLLSQSLLMMYLCRKKIIRRVIEFKEFILKSNPKKIDDEYGAWYTKKEIVFLHGCGHNGHMYNNSLEGIECGISNGYKYIEVDVDMTSDGIFVLTHRFRPDNEVIFESRPTYEQFMEKGVLENETPLSLEMFLSRFCNSDCFFLLDCSHWCEMRLLEWLHEKYSKQMLKNIIFQVHTISLLKKAYNTGVFSHIHFNSTLKSLMNNLNILFRYNVHTCSISDEEIQSYNVKFINEIAHRGMHIIVYTVNHPRRYRVVMQYEVRGIFTDKLKITNTVSGTVKHPAQNSFLDKPPCLISTNLAFEVKITQH